MGIRLSIFFQVLACLLISFIMATHSASAAVTIDFRYGLQDGADCSNEAMVRLQIEQDGDIEEIFAEQTVGMGRWSEPQSVEIPKQFTNKDFILIWVSDPVDGNFSCDWLVVEDPRLVVNGVDGYSFFDNYEDAEFTTITAGGDVISYGTGKEGSDGMWNDSGCLFVQLPWSKENGIDVIPDAVEGEACVRTIFFHPPSKGPTAGGVGAVRFEIERSMLNVEPKAKLTITWGKLKRT